ncbi:type II secretion system minor pseudopilin GspJ [Cellvibrio sp.]|uniref:type II secretion system minor pseudopilin GspJ n=1 Tax=Cellvibrio sp. TaxID=1965322 RepID=UPI0039647E53
MNSPRRVQYSGATGQRGFTLLEMVIAIALSALVAAMAYQSFDGASRNAERTRDVLNEVNSLDKAWQLIGQDMRNILPLNPQIPNPQLKFEAASLKTKGKDSFQVIMIFARRGWVNPLGRVRSDLQQVNYRIAEGKLWRDYLPERNMPLENIDFERESFHQLLMDNVVDVQLRFLSLGRIKADGKSVLEGSEYSRNWEPMWPPVNAGGGPSMPVALEMTIELEGGARSVRLFEIPQK